MNNNKEFYHFFFILSYIYFCLNFRLLYFLEFYYRMFKIDTLQNIINEIKDDFIKK